MELLGFQLGYANHHPFVCWTRARKEKACEQARLEKFKINPGDLPEEASDQHLMLTALSL